MRIVLKSARDMERMRPACRIAREVLEEVAAKIQPGMTTKLLDELAAEEIKRRGAVSAFLGYRVGNRRYPCHVCISVNEAVVHGLAGENRINFGDIVSLDVGVVYNGYIGDNAATIPVGGCDAKTQRLLDVTEQSLYEGIAQAVPGNRVEDISRAVQQCVEGAGFSVVREFVGHGVGATMHEEPQIPNYVEPGKSSPKLKPGMTLAIEPMVNMGRAEVRVLKDGWTVVTEDGLLSAHFEHTILVTDGVPEILTCRDSKPLRPPAG